MRMPSSVSSDVHLGIEEIEWFAVEKVQNIVDCLLVAFAKDVHRGIAAVRHEDGIIEAA